MNKSDIFRHQNADQEISIRQTKPENYLAGTEISEEENYNMIDGVPNNTAVKPSLRSALQQIRENTQKQTETPSEPAHEQERRMCEVIQF